MPALAAARAFIAQVLEAEPPPDEDALIVALDELVQAYHRLEPAQFADDDREPPEEDFLSLYHRIGDRFPALGYYPAPLDPLDAESVEIALMDAIDDLADIVRDLRNICWRAQHLGIDDAHWHYRFLFDIHWSAHLRSLSLHLHFRRSRRSEG